MPTTINAAIGQDNHDGKTTQSTGFRDMTETILGWGSTSGTNYGIEPIFIFSGISIPKGRHIVSAFSYYTPTQTRSDTAFSPNGGITVEKDASLPELKSTSNILNASYFPVISAPMLPWQTDVEIKSSELTRYVQELVLSADWVESNNNIIVRLVDNNPVWDGGQKYVSVYAREHPTGNPPRLVIQYSDRSVSTVETRRYPVSTPTSNRQSWYHGYRILISQQITISGLWGGATDPTNFALWNDNNGVPGSLLTSAVGSPAYGVNRVNPVVISPGWYWVGSGSVTSHNTVAGVSSLNRASLITANPFISQVQPSSGIYQASSSTLGAPGVFTGASVSTVSREFAYGFDYVVGNHLQDDVTPPSLSTNVLRG